MNLGSTINRNYVLQNQTAMVVWNLIYSWYSILTYATTAGGPGGMGHGLMTAGKDRDDKPRCSGGAQPISLTPFMYCSSAVGRELQARGALVCDDAHDTVHGTGQLQVPRE